MALQVAQGMRKLTNFVKLLVQLSSALDKHC